MNSIECIIKNVRLIAKGQQPEIDIHDILQRHKCYSLLRGVLTNQDNVNKALNQICINERFRTSKSFFETLESESVDYAVIKGAVLSQSIYNDPYVRVSGDIDILIKKSDSDKVKQILAGQGFIQGRVIDGQIQPFSRQEILFQTAMSHQMAPFIKRTENRFCPFVNIDVNTDIIWGENSQKTDMNAFLENKCRTNIYGTDILKLQTEEEFISLCLHHYKDMNSIYLISTRGIPLHLFTDIYGFILNCDIDSERLAYLCDKFQVKKYVYYCVYFTHKMFDDERLIPLVDKLKTDEAEYLMNTFGLADSERKTWNVEFFNRVFTDNLFKIIEPILTKTDKKKIKSNINNM